MKKLLIITNRLVVGGPTKHVALLAKGLHDKYEVLIVGGSAAPGEEMALEQFVGMEKQVIQLLELNRNIHLRNDYLVYKKLKKIIKGFKPDIVHTHTSKPGLLGRLAAKKMKVPTIVHTYHGLIYENYFSSFFSKLIVKVDRYLASFSHHIIALSENQKTELSEKYKIAPANKIVVVPLALSNVMYFNDKGLRTAFQSKYGIGSDTVAIGIIGRLVPIKNIQLFLEAIQFLHEQKIHKIKAFVVGDGPEMENLKEYATKLGLSYSFGDPDPNDKMDVYFTSWNKDLNFVYSGLDIIALTSKSEGTPMSLMEAQSAGKTVIASNVGGVKDIVVEGTGLLFDIDKPNDFFNYLQDLVENKEYRLKIGEQAKKHAIKAYDKKLMVNRMNDLYNDIT